jgi:hypothetical protein
MPSSCRTKNWAPKIRAWLRKTVKKHLVLSTQSLSVARVWTLICGLHSSSQWPFAVAHGPRPCKKEAGSLIKWRSNTVVKWTEEPTRMSGHVDFFSHWLGVEKKDFPVMLQAYFLPDVHLRLVSQYCYTTVHCARGKPEWSTFQPFASQICHSHYLPCFSSQSFFCSGLHLSASCLGHGSPTVLVLLPSFGSN